MASAAANPKAIITQAANAHGIDPAILWGVFGTETGFGADDKTSSAGAEGDLQLEPGTARSLGVKDPNNLVEAANGAAKYLAEFKGRGTGGMLSAYNAGPAGGYQAGYVATTLANAKSYGGSSTGVSLTPQTPSVAAPAAQTVTIPGTPAKTVESLDKPAFEKAEKAAVAGKLLASEGGIAGNPLFSTGLLTTVAPSKGEFTTSKTIPGTAPVSREVSSGTSAGASASGPVAPEPSTAGASVGASVGVPGVKAAPPPSAIRLPPKLPGAVAKGKEALERASGHPVSLPELEKEVNAGTKGHYAVPAGPRKAVKAPPKKGNPNAFGPGV
jgi:Transglycosylase SLT domain